MHQCYPCAGCGMQPDTLETACEIIRPVSKSHIKKNIGLNTTETKAFNDVFSKEM